MAIPFSDNFSIGVGNPIDAKYLNALNQPYSATTAAINRIPESQRYIGLTVNINNVEYWWKNGVADPDLIIKTVSTSGGTGTITGGTNGLRTVGKNIVLGGVLTGDTTFDGGILQYAVSPIFTSGSQIVDKNYVDLLKYSGTSYHIPVFNVSGDKIQDTTLKFCQDKLFNFGDLTVEVPDGNKLYLLGKPYANQSGIILGKPSLDSGYTISNILVDGLATDIDLKLQSKGLGSLSLNAPDVYIGNCLSNGMRYDVGSSTLRMPKSGTTSGYGGDASTPNASPTYIVGGDGYGQTGFAGSGGAFIICGGDALDGIGGQNCIGGDVVIRAGLGVNAGANGSVRICQLPTKSTESNVLYYNTSTGKLAYGQVTGTSTYNGASPTTCKAGGVDPNTVISGKTYTELFEMILVPALNPALNPPFNTFSSSPASGSVCEVGQILSPLNFTATFNQGSIVPQYPPTGSPYRSGPLTTFNYTGAGLPPSGGGSQSIPNYTVQAGTVLNTWSSTASYLSGVTVYNSKGQFYAAGLGAGTTGSQSVSITGIFPYFWGSSPTSAPVAGQLLINSGNKVVANSNGYIDVNFNVSDDYIWLAIPSANTQKTKWEGSNAPTTNTETIPGGLFNAPSSVSVNSPVGSYWSSIPYSFYISNYKTSTISGTPYTIRFCN
jgi:hypothetical protein